MGLNKFHDVGTSDISSALVYRASWKGGKVGGYILKQGKNNPHWNPAAVSRTESPIMISVTHCQVTLSAVSKAYCTSTIFSIKQNISVC